MSRLPGGFKHADELPRRESKWEPEPPEAFEKGRKRRSRSSEEKINCLRDAIRLFAVSVDASKKKDIKLDGLRVGSLFKHNSLKDQYLVLFKREFYFHFSRHFPIVPDKGYGVMSNLKLVHWCALEGIRLAAVFPDGRCYWIDGLEFWRFYEDYNTEVPAAEGEIACPLSMWKRLF